MTKLLTFFSIMILLISASNKVTSKIIINNYSKQQNDSTNYHGLNGTWVCHNKRGFKLIEIKDTSNVTFYMFMDRKAFDDTITTNRFWYYKSIGKMGYWNNPTNSLKANVDIWISTENYRFDFRIKGDTLIEVDKMGDQETFLKVNNVK